MNKKTFVANWKMQLTFHQAIDFVKENIDQFSILAKQSDREIILCPSYTELYPISLLTSDTHLQIGAQNVSPYSHGAYTGQVNASSLAEIGCTYCIIGHSESRAFLHETNEDVAQKCAQLFAQGIIPIICLDEAIIESQFVELFELFTQSDPEQEYIIAYEPISAIGTGNIPSIEHLNKIFKKLNTLCKNHPNPFRLLYGGSVHPDNASQLLTIEHIDGLLIGGASLNIDTFVAIVQNA